MSGTHDKDHITRLHLRSMLADGLLAGMDATELREVAAAGCVPVQPNMSERELLEAIRASNAARALAGGVPVDRLPTLTAQEAHQLARQLSGEPARPDEPE
jgi:hypothetical protein